MAPTVAFIDLDALGRNLDLLRERAHGKTMMAVVKANAYGHGALPVARRLQASGVDWFSVATLPEAVALRGGGISSRILVFGASMPDELPAYAEFGLDVGVVSLDTLDSVCSSGLPLRVHLKVDTGMGRLGVMPNDAAAAARRIESTPGLELAGLWTHLAAADRPGDAFTDVQLSRWRRFVDTLSGLEAPIHVSASPGVANRPEILEGTHMVRAGIALYGLYHDAAAFGQRAPEPVMRVVSRVSRVQHVPAGTPISYGGTWTAPEDVRIATVAAGYADGYPRRLSNRGQVGIAGSRCPVVGTVCMDMVMVAVPQPLAVRQGDEVVLLGTGGPTCQELADWAGTITYDVVCGISPRVERKYLTSNAVAP